MLQDYLGFEAQRIGTAVVRICYQGSTKNEQLEQTLWAFITLSSGAFFGSTEPGAGRGSFATAPFGITTATVCEKKLMN